MNILVIADPVEGLKIATDSTLYLSWEFVVAGATLHWANADEIFWSPDGLKIVARRCERVGSRTKAGEFSEPQEFSIRDFSLGLIRKEPPFDHDYLRLCWFLAGFENEVLFSNKPSVLLRHHEKMMPFEMYEKGVLETGEIVKSFMGCGIQNRVAQYELWKDAEIVMKPFDGHGGRHIQKFSGALEENMSSAQIFQKYIPEVKTCGDRRVLFLHSNYQADFVRIPSEDSFVANLAQGGRAEKRPLSKKEEKIISKLERWFDEQGIDFAGADFIDSKLSEVNITCPTGLSVVEDLEGVNLAKNFARHWIKKIKAKNARR